MLPGSHWPGHGYPVPQWRHPHPTITADTAGWVRAASAVAIATDVVVVELAEVEVSAVAVEVHHMVGAARVSGFLQDLGEPGEGGRPQHVQVQAVHLVSPAADQPGGYRAERHILAAPRAADDQQHPQPVPARLRQVTHPACGLQMGADELTRAQRQRRIGAGVTQQFPRQARGLGRVGVHLHPHPAQPRLRPIPDTGRVLTAEHLLEQETRAGAGQDLLGAGGQRRGRVGGEFGVVLQVPADLLPVRSPAG